MKEPHQLSADWIEACNVRPFAQIAAQTAQCEVIRYCGLSMLCGDHVIDRKCVKRIVFLTNVAGRSDCRPATRT